MPFGEHGVAVFVAVGLEIQFFMTERPDLGTLVENEGFDQTGPHGRFQVEIHNDVREEGFPAVPTGADLIVRRRGEVQLYEAAPLWLGDEV